ncbi:MAG: hypothetical protein ABI885_07000, partial [Gammaproteobacteria bacterium]
DLESVRKELSGKIDAVRVDVAAVRDSVATVRESVAAVRELVASTKVWTLRLVMGAGCGVLYVVAHGLKWL